MAVLFRLHGGVLQDMEHIQTAILLVPTAPVRHCTIAPAGVSVG